MSPMLRRWIIGLSLLLIVAGTGATDIPGITVEVNPTSLELPTEGSIEATLVVRNPTELTARQVQVNHADLPGVTVEIEPTDSQTIPSKGAFVWTVKIGQAGTGMVSGDVNFQVHYTLVDENGTEFSDVVFTKITVSSRDQEDASQIVAVTVHSTLAELNDFRPGYIYLQVENKSDAPVEITDVIVSERPGFIVLKPSVNMTPLPAQESRIPYGELTQIPAGQSRIFPVYVASGDQVRPGEHMLIFNVLFQRTVNGETQTGSVVEEHKVKVKVFGEEEVLGVITSVTTFLFVPGFLMIMIAGMAWKLFVPGPTKEKFPFSLTTGTITDPRFWVIMITLSLLMAWKGYPALSAVFLESGRRDFLYGYGFQDIIWMWLFSISIGVVFSVLAAAVVRGCQEIAGRREMAEFERAIKPTDEAMVVLEKIVELGFHEARFRKATVSDSKKKGFLIEHDRPGKTTFWIAPRITIWWDEDATDLRDEFDDLVEKEETRLPDLLEKLKEGLASSQGKRITQVVWTAEDGYIDSPMEVDKSGRDPSQETESPFLHEWVVR